jgi:hypothetical protein
LTFVKLIVIIYANKQLTKGVFIMNKELMSLLYAEIPVSIKPGYGNYKYVKTKHVLDRLNDVFQGNWSCTVLKYELIGNELVIWVRVEVFDTEHKRVLCQDGFGSAKKFDKVDLGNIFKSAKSKAIKDAVKSWGVGLDIEGVASNTKSSTQPTGSAGPSGPPSPGTAGPAGGPTGVSNPGSTMPPGGQASMPSGPSGMSTGTSQGMPPGPSPISSVQESVPEPTKVPEQSPVLEETTGQLPSFSLPETGRVSAGSDTGGAANEVTHDTSDMPATLVQKTAIMSKLEALGIPFDTYIQEAYTKLGIDTSNLPKDIDELTYKSAMALASYSN